MKGLTRSVAIGVCTLAAPVALMAQAPPVVSKIDSIASQAAANSTSINFVWTLIAGFLVMFMQAGFALVETGFTRSKNAGHTMTMNFMVYAIGMLAYWAIGFALQAGGIGALTTLGGYDKLNTEFSIHLAGHDVVDTDRVQGRAMRVAPHERTNSRATRDQRLQHGHARFSARAGDEDHVRDIPTMRMMHWSWIDSP